MLNFKSIIIKTKKIIFIAILIFILFDYSYSQTTNKNVILLCKESNWLYGADASITFSWDDTNLSHSKIASILEEYGFRGSFFVYPGRHSWCLSAIKEYCPNLVAKGHEVGNHSMNHLNLKFLELNEIIYEVNEPNQILYNITGIWPVSFVQPYNATNGLVDSVVFATYLFTRIRSQHNMNERVLTGSIISSTTIDEMQVWIDSVKNSGKWLHIAGHGIDGSGWESITSEFLHQICQLIKNSDKKFWVGTMAEIGAYEYLKEELSFSSSFSDNVVEISIDGFDSERYSKIPKLPFTIELKLNKEYKLNKLEDLPYLVSYDILNNKYLVTFDVKSTDKLVLPIEYSPQTSGKVIEENQTIVLYPNPTDDLLFIKGIENVNILIYDVYGRLMLSTFIEQQIDISSLLKGVYLLKINNVKVDIIRKIIKK
jgi:peptidoglycan/xylan/chitin deacetylase (PgdA/CDA1 family)